MPSCLILNYHRVLRIPLIQPSSFCIYLPSLRAQLNYIKGNNIPVVPLKEIDVVKSNSVALTFDDGHLSDCTSVLPILDEFGFKGSFFIPLNSEGYKMKKEVYREAIRNGHSIGVHGKEHKSLRGKFIAQQQDEILFCKNELEEVMETSISDLAVPYGRYSKSTLEAAYRSGIKRVYGSRFGSYQSGSGSGIIPRFTVKRGTTMSNFEKVLSGDRMSFFKLKLTSLVKQKVLNTVNPELIFKVQKMMTP